MHQNTNTNMAIIGCTACILQVSTAQASIHHFEFKSSIMLGYLPKRAQIVTKPPLTSTTNNCTIRVFSRASSSQLSLPHQPLLLLHPGRLMSWQPLPHIESVKIHQQARPSADQAHASLGTASQMEPFLPLQVPFCRFGRFLVVRVHWRAKAEFCW